MDYFSERSQQVDTGPMKCFGISVVSRYSKLREITEMMFFCEYIAKRGRHGLITEVFYDSKAQYCTFTFKTDDLSVEDLDIITQGAKLSISQFELNGSIEHGCPMKAIFREDQ